MNALDQAIDELASRQHGSLGTDQLRAAGATREAVRYRLENRRLFRGPYPRTFRHPAFVMTWEGRLWAIQLWAGPSGAIANEAAGALYELDACPTGRVAVKLPKGIRHWTAGVPMHETTHGIVAPRRINGLLVTSPEETIVDLAHVLPYGDADDALHSALRRRLTTVDRIEPLLDGRPGTVVARDLLNHARGSKPRDSKLEGRFIRRARAKGFTFGAQFEGRVDGHRYSLDFADPLRKVGIELDGFESHATKKGFQHDATRSTLLTLAGWRILHFTWDDIRHRPDWVLECLTRALAVA
jgi:very-short-patch-repair endonuclease